jgi:hypothetical protein
MTTLLIAFPLLFAVELPPRIKQLLILAVVCLLLGSLARVLYALLS